MLIIPSLSFVLHHCVMGSLFPSPRLGRRKKNRNMVCRTPSPRSRYFFFFNTLLVSRSSLKFSRVWLCVIQMKHKVPLPPCTTEPFVTDISCLNLGLSCTMFTHESNAWSISSLLPLQEGYQKVQGILSARTSKKIRAMILVWWCDLCIHLLEINFRAHLFLIP